jgi:hypothetical protein
MNCSSKEPEPHGPRQSVPNNSAECYRNDGAVIGHALDGGGSLRDHVAHRAAERFVLMGLANAVYRKRSWPQVQPNWLSVQGSI